MKNAPHWVGIIGYPVMIAWISFWIAAVYACVVYFWIPLFQLLRLLPL